MNPNGNFRKHPKKHHRPSVDGILSDNSRPQAGSIDFVRPTSNPVSPKLDNFRRAEGFQPSARPAITVGSSQPTVMPTFHSTLRLEDIDNVPPRGKKRRGRSGKKIVARSVLSLLLIVVLGVGFLFGKGYLNARNIFKGGAAGAAALQDNVDPALLKGEGDGRVNIMVLGKGGMGHPGADLTDTILIASIDPLQKEASLLSVPRDLYVKVPNLGSMKINTVYANAKQRVLSGKKTSDQVNEAERQGLDTIQKSLEQSMGIPIHYYVMIDFEGFRQAIDTVGGISVDVKEQLYDASVAWENGNNPVIAPKGLQTMNGKKALLYSRSRMGSVRGDFDRSVRQREVILALKDKILNLGTFANPLKISQLADTFGSHVQSNLSISASNNEVMRLYTISKDIPGNKITSLGLADPPNNYVTTDFIDGQSVVVPRAGLYNFKNIQNYVRNSLKDGFLRNENASVIILNGTTTAGLANIRADELKSYGYNVDRIGDAPTKNYSRTILVDLRGGTKKYTRRYLEQRLGVIAVESLPDGAITAGTADFVIILGQNETSTNTTKNP